MQQALSLEAIQRFTEPLAYGVTVNSLDGKYVQANPSFCKISGYDETELLNLSFFDITHPDDLEINIDLDSMLKAGKIPYYQLAKRYITKLGKQKNVLVQASVIRDDQKAPAYYYVQVIDISDLGNMLVRVASEDISSRAKSEIPIEQRYTNISYNILHLYNQLNQRKINHLANIAHELKNPLNGVRGTASLMKRALEKGETEKASLMYRKFEDSANTLERFISELLDLTYIETGNLEPHFSNFDLVELVHEAIDSLDTLSHQHKIPVTNYSQNRDPIFITSDKKRLWEIFTNLISNAIKYTESGQVDVYLEEVDENQYNFKVVDSGIGIREEDLDAIFDEYQTVHAHIGKEVDSTGLGLPIAKRLISMLGGKINVASKVGVGTTFTVSIRSLTQQTPKKL